ncbi:ricin-type beta-trefoil lectin domain protein [Streptomyces tendae]
MTTSKPDGIPDESTATATARAEAGVPGEAEEEREAAARTTERILAPVSAPVRAAVPAALAEEEAEPVPEGEGEVEPEQAEAPEQGEAPQKAGAEEAETTPSEGVAATDPGSESSGPGATATAAAGVPGRPNKGLLAAAAIVGVLLICVPFLISGGDDGERPGKPGATPGTVLEGAAEGEVPVVVGSETPSPHTSTGSRAAKPGAHGTVKSTAPDGRTVLVTVPPAPAGTGGGQKTDPSSVKPGGGGRPAETSRATTGAGGSGSGNSQTTTESQQEKPAPTDPWTGGVQIYSHDSGRCIGIVGSPGAASGSALEIWDCANVSWHRWKFVGGTVRSQDKCMTVRNGSGASGADIIWTTCNGSGSQQFRLNARHDLTNPQSGNKCVDVRDKGTANGTRLQLWTCYGTDNQKWSTRTP